MTSISQCFIMYVSDIIGYLSVLLVLLAKAKRGEADAVILCLSKESDVFRDSTIWVEGY